MLRLNGGSFFGNGLQVAQGQKLTFDGAAGAKYFSSNGTTLTLTGLSLTMTGILTMPSLTGITWGTDSIVNGAGQYTGLCRSLPNGSSWPLPATIFHTGTVGANVSTGETTLVQNLHTNQFGNDADVAGRGWHIRAWGTFGATANAKTIKLKFGPTQTDVTGGSFTTSTNGGSWELDCIILRTTGTSAQSARASWKFTGSAPASSLSVTAPTEATATNDWAITLTGTGGASNDIANAIMRVDFLP